MAQKKTSASTKTTSQTSGNKQAFTVPAEFSGATTLVDGGVSVRFKTQELSPDEKRAIFDYVQNFGWLLFATRELQKGDIPDKVPEGEYDGKKPSQRLRGAIMVLWQKMGEPGDSEAFYRRTMERLIGVVRHKIDKVEG